MYKRPPYLPSSPNVADVPQEVAQLINQGAYLEALDLIEAIVDSDPDNSFKVLACAYDLYQQLPDKESRYWLYQARHYNFPISDTDKVLDIGSGHLPFPYATHLADLAIEDHNFGRAGIPFKHIEGKPVFNCGVEDMPFEDKEFDFVYCSHVLEHVTCPITACKELMRVAKRGYLECPSRGKDLFLNTAKISNHKWMVEYFDDRLVFTEYNQEQLKGLSSNILMSMHCAPESEREKAFSALVLLKAEQVNTMLMWEDGFQVEVRKIGCEPVLYQPEATENSYNYKQGSPDHCRT